ncbi:MAG: PAS domain S-box protein [Vulcanimicrobiaceae bacterium]
MNADFDVDRFSRIFAREVPDAVIYADAEGCIRFWNKAAERIFGFSESEAVRQTLDLIIPEHLRKRHWDGFSRTMQTGKTRYGAGNVLEVPALRKDGTRIFVEFSMLPFHDENERMIGIAVVLRDVTERYNEMKGLREQLGALSSRGSSWH